MEFFLQKSFGYPLVQRLNPEAKRAARERWPRMRTAAALGPRLLLADRARRLRHRHHLRRGWEGEALDDALEATEQWALHVGHREIYARSSSSSSSSAPTSPASILSNAASDPSSIPAGPPTERALGGGPPAAPSAAALAAARPAE